MTKVDIDLWWYPTIEKNGGCQNCLNWQTSGESADLLEERNRPSFDEWEVLSLSCFNFNILLDVTCYESIEFIYICIML